MAVNPSHLQSLKQAKLIRALKNRLVFFGSGGKKNQEIEILLKILSVNDPHPSLESHWSHVMKPALYLILHTFWIV